MFSVRTELQERQGHGSVFEHKRVLIAVQAKRDQMRAKQRHS
jgi:hypothetical protein